MPYHGCSRAPDTSGRSLLSRGLHLRNAGPSGLCGRAGHGPVACDSGRLKRMRLVIVEGDIGRTRRRPCGDIRSVSKSKRQRVRRFEGARSYVSPGRLGEDRGGRVYKYSAGAPGRDGWVRTWKGNSMVGSGRQITDFVAGPAACRVQPRHGAIERLRRSHPTPAADPLPTV